MSIPTRIIKIKSLYNCIELIFLLNNQLFTGFVIHFAEYRLELRDLCRSSAETGLHLKRLIKRPSTLSLPFDSPKETKSRLNRPF